MRLGHSIIIDGIKGVVESILEDGERLIRFEDPIEIEKRKLALPHYMGREAEEYDLIDIKLFMQKNPVPLLRQQLVFTLQKHTFQKFLIPLLLYMLALERSGPSKPISLPIMICIVNFMRFPKTLQIRSMRPTEKFLLEQQSLES